MKAPIYFADGNPCPGRTRRGLLDWRYTGSLLYSTLDKMSMGGCRCCSRHPTSMRGGDGSLGPEALKPAAEAALREWTVSPRLNRTGVG